MELPLFYTILFFIVFSVYFFFAVYILHLNKKAAVNRMFFAVCISLCFWSFGFAMSVGSLDMETALIWRRYSAIGWSTIYANILIFMLILTGRSILLRKWWLYVLVYGPSAVILMVFSILNTTVTFEYNLVQVNFGWMNVSASTIWDALFYVYYVGCIAGCIAVALYWKKKASDASVSRQANMIIASFVAALILGSLTDVILPISKQHFLPQMAPVIILIPISVFYYCIKRYGLMSPEMSDSNQVILSNETRTQLFVSLSAIFVFAGIVSFLYAVLFSESTILKAALISGILVLIGFSMFMIQFIKAELLRYALNLTIVLLSIPAVTLLFFQYGSVTSWVFPVVLFLVALVFNRRSMIAGVAIVSLLTQVVLWMYSKYAPFQLPDIDYVMRIIFFLILILLGMRINKIYLSKLRENAYQIRFQKLISDISYDFARVNKSNLDESIDSMLQSTGGFFDADRSYVFLLDHESGVIRLSYEWCREGISPELGLLQPLPFSQLTKIIEELKNKHTVYYQDAGKLQEAHIIKTDLFINQNIVSLILAPIAANDQLYGFFGFSTYKSSISISDNNLELLQTFANLISDKLKMVETEKEIEYMAYYDQLTGLPSRPLFHDRAWKAIHLAQRQAKYLGFISMDLDSFKSVNDTMGHSGGDELIREVAKALCSHVRKSDTVARLGGDEFLIMLCDISECSQVRKVIDNLMSLFTEPFRLQDQEYFITASAGVAVYPYDGEDVETLVKNADTAMYKAKALGANRYILCTQQMKDEVRNTMILTNSLYRALEREEFTLHYQPQIQIDTGAVIGLEALLRWTHPTMGMIPPSVFIPLAEKNGLINSIGEWVLRTACRQNRVWQEMGLPHLRMAVNLSPVQFRNPRLISTIELILKEITLAPEELELEITESAAVNDSGHISSMLASLKQLGVSISIDDFGTEYSSLSRLKELPIDRLKIDMQFIRGLEESEKDQAITMVIINLAKNLGLHVIAEGVETESQLEFLRIRDCDEVQGYYFSKPLPADEIPGLLTCTAV